MRRGRPLRFLATVVLCWIGGRAAILSRAGDELPPALREAPAVPRMAVRPSAPSRQWRIGSAAIPAPVVPVNRDAAGQRAAPFIAPPAKIVSPAPRLRPERPAPRSFPPAVVAVATVAPPPVEVSAVQVVPQPRVPQPRVPQASSAQASRWSASGWLIARSGTGLGASPDAPQLGGSQGGIRIDYALSRTVAVTGRLAAPAAGAGREASLGLAWRPAGVPLRFVVEQRFALDRGRGGAALGVSGGVSDVALPARFRLEGYAQAGLIARDGIEHYADGIVRAARPLGAAGGLAFDLGAGAWGGVQRGVSRLDAGPTIGARLPVAGRAVRVALDWRQRVAGNARPGSGPALAIGADF